MITLEGALAVLGFYIVVPSAALCGTRLLLRARAYYATGLLWFLFFGIYASTLSQLNPSTSLRRNQLTLALRDMRGQPVSGALLEITHYRHGQLIGHTHATRRTDANGNAVIDSAWDIWTSILIRAEGFRPCGLDIERTFAQFPNRACSFRWRLLHEGEKHFGGDNTGSIRFTVPRHTDYHFDLTLPGPTDDDRAIEELNTKSVARGQL